VSDDFNDNSLDTAKWDTNLFSGFTNTSVPLAEANAQLEIGPLLTTSGTSAYRGVRTVNTYNFSGAYSFVELVKAPENNTTGFAMFTIGTNVDNYYRLYVSGGNLIGEKKIAGSKSTLFTIPYDLTNHRFLRIRHDATAGAVYLDTAPGSSGVPGSWTQRYTETWNSSISLSAIIFEVKGGTSVVQSNAPGKVIFDNFVVAVPGSGSPNTTSLKMVTANLQHGESTSGSANYAGQANKITSTSDLVTAQEVSVGDIPSWDTAFTAGGFRRVISQMHLNGGDGNAIWARNSISVIQTWYRDLANGVNPTTGSDVFGLDGSDIRRTAVAAKLSFNSKQFYVVSVHLCPKACRDNANTFESVQRVTQIQDLLSWVDSTLTGGLPVLLMGDFNTTTDTPKQPSGFQFDLFTQAGFSDLWQTGLTNSVASANWADMDQNSIPDMPLGTNTRTHDSRRIDFILYKPNSGSLPLINISVPDGRAQCSGQLVPGDHPYCPDVQFEQRIQLPEDYGVRLSDHNWLYVELGF